MKEVSASAQWEDVGAPDKKLKKKKSLKILYRKGDSAQMEDKIKE